MAELAVLTGDIVKSRSLSAPDLDAVFARLEADLQAFSAHFDADLHFMRYRGDGWQASLGTAALGLRAAVIAAAAVQSTGRGRATRLVLAQGSGVLDPKTQLAGASGPVFETAGAVLDRMKAPARFHICRSDGRSDPLGFALDLQIQGWTPTQAAYIGAAIRETGLRQSDLAQIFTVSQQNVQKTLESAGYWALDLILREYEAIIPQT